MTMVYKNLKQVSIALLVFLSATAHAATVGNATRHIEFKGLNTKSGPLTLGDGESPQCMNVHSNIFATLIKRKGYTKNAYSHTHVTTSTGKTNGLFDFAVDTTTRKFIRYLDNHLYSYGDFASNPDRIKFTTAMTNDIMEFENFDGTLIMSTWSRDLGQSWGGTGLITSDITNMPQGRHIIRAYTRMFVMNCDVGGTTYPLRFYFSNAASYTAWTTGTDYETLDGHAGDEGMGWGLVKGGLYGFTKYTVNLVSDIGGATPMSASRRIDGIGCGAPRTIKTISVPDFGESLIWLSQDKKLYLWNGSNLKEISRKIHTNNDLSLVYMNAINTTNLKYCHAQVYEKYGWYVLWIPISTNIDYAIVYDYLNDNFWSFNNQNFHSSALVETSTGTLLYVGDKTGGLHKWDDGVSDNGSNINAYWLSRKWDFGFLPALKKMGEVRLTTKTIGEYDLTYNYRYNFSTTWSTDELLTMFNGEWILGDVLPATLGGQEAQPHRLTIPGAFNLFQIKLTDNSSNPAFEVYSMDLVTNLTGAIGD